MEGEKSASVIVNESLQYKEYDDVLTKTDDTINANKEKEISEGVKEAEKDAGAIHANRMDMLKNATNSTDNTAPTEPEISRAQVHQEVMARLKRNTGNASMNESEVAMDQYDQEMSRMDLVINREQYKDLKEALDKSTFGFKGNSAFMKDFKQSLNDLSDVLDKKCFTKEEIDEGEYHNEASKIQNMYTVAIAKADTYLKNRKGAKTPTGKKRFAMVQDIHAILSGEKNIFLGAAQNILEDMKEEKNAIKFKSLKWSDIMYHVRAIKMPKGELAEGGVTKSTKKVNLEGKEYFYKKEEIVNLLDTDREGFFNITADVEDDKLFIQRGMTRSECDAKKATELIQGAKVNFIAFMEKNVSRIRQDSVDEEDRNLLKIYNDSKTLFECFDKLKDKTAFSLLRDYMCALNPSFKNNAPKMNRYMMDIYTRQLGFMKDKINNASDCPQDIKQTLLTKLDEMIEDPLRIEAARRINLTAKVAVHNGIDNGTELSLRNVATSRMAKYLGMNDLIAESKTVLVENENGNLNRGNLMEKARGMEIYDILEKCKDEGKEVKGATITSEAAEKLLKLSMLDFVTGQLDRHLGNVLFGYEIRESKSNKNEVYVELTDIQGIDNDMAFGSYNANELKYGYNRLAGFMNKDGEGLLNAVTPDIFDSFVNIDIDEVKYLLSDCGLNDKEKDALSDRIDFVKNYFARKKKSMKRRKFVCDDLSSRRYLNLVYNSDINRGGSSTGIIAELNEAFGLAQFSGQIEIIKKS